MGMILELNKVVYLTGPSKNGQKVRARSIPDICHFFYTKFLENKIYTKKARTLRQNTQKIANFLRYYSKIHSKLPIFRIKSVKIYTGQKNLHWRRQQRQ